MRLRLKPLPEQVLVITGASSGIGRTAARLAAEAGARLVLAARDAGALDDAAAECERAGGRAVTVACDVADPADVRRLARRAERAFGGVDTWVNNAGATIYGTLDEVPLEDMRRLMDVNFWGVVHGSRAAVPLLEARGGGALVNVGSVLSERAIPLQGMYCATKHAVLAFTDALRMELARRRAPVSVSLVKPASIDTPFYDTARNYMDRRPRPVPPVYAPEVPARAILECAVRPTRDVYAGGAARVIAEAGRRAPALTDKAMERVLFGGQQADGPPVDAEGSLYGPLDRAAERGRYEREGGHDFGDGAGRAAAEAIGTVLGTARGVGRAALAAGFGVGLTAAALAFGRRGVDDRHGGGRADRGGD
jgi:short-subunit dehydrogenase